jgi:ABC-type antimicrobial peptide transport system permease subunit
MLAYSVSQRTREIGIRMAVGATNARVFRMIILNGLKLSGAGIAVGLLLASALASALPENMVAPADPQDPIVYGAVVGVLLSVTLLSCYFPARRASRVDPQECLRSE